MKSGVAIIFGATSGIGIAIGAELAKVNKELILVARDKDELKRVSGDLNVRYANINHSYCLDLFDSDRLQTSIKQIIDNHDSVDELYFLMGYMGEAAKARDDWDEREQILLSCYTNAVHVLSEFAEYFEKQRNGNMTIVSSVAGDRGRQSNYIYGSAKAGLTAFAGGLRNRLYKHNVHVVTVKPGFVDTAMTYGLPGIFLAASPETVAKIMIKAVRRKKNVLYVPGFWRYIMMIIKLIPERLFKRLAL
ncbi:MAG: SDR family NAD(P)-dependent oxidoreductase [Calditrichaceae bacterium]